MFVKPEMAATFYTGKVCSKHPELQGRRRRPGKCAACCKEYAKARRLDPAKNAHDSALVKQSTWRDPVSHLRKLVQVAKRRARAAGLPFDLALEALLPAPVYCPVLGIPLWYGPFSGCMFDSKDNRPSLDRIDNTKGYLEGNVCVISYRANRLKGDATPQEMEAVASYVRTMQLI